MYSIIVDEKVLDIKYKKTPLEGTYNCYLGDIFIGQLFKLKSGWSCVVFKVVDGLRNVCGFKTRTDAVIYMLRMSGYYKRGN